MPDTEGDAVSLAGINLTHGGAVPARVPHLDVLVTVRLNVLGLTSDVNGGEARVAARHDATINSDPIGQTLKVLVVTHVYIITAEKGVSTTFHLI